MSSGLALRDAPGRLLAADQTSESLSSLARRLFATRRHSLDLAAPLSPEDQVVQPSDDASPTKWHLAHVTWFFETFLLKPYLPGYTLFDERFPFCFNSYYEAEGERQPRGSRGLLTRPTRDEVLAYRAHIDAGLAALLASEAANAPDVRALIEVGINHEQQHQELLLTDVLSLFAASPLRPAYRDDLPAKPAAAVPEMTFKAFDGGIHDVGHDGIGFSFDNESPRHKALLQPFALADRLVTNAEWLQFIEADGYGTANLWLMDGWITVKTERWRAPLYWEQRAGRWMRMTLGGLVELDLAAPVSHISFYEADAYARWAEKRLPTEFEWEFAALASDEQPAVAQSQYLRPQPDAASKQFFGEVWQWTQSAYLPYPGYRAAPGAIGEYNGKFMVSQQVLRGSSCATPAGHARATYRNFFYPHQRWQFTGLRLASDL
ncbi:ergothioneine biosynthesis protein EgtB [Beijerinckia sp. L45]|uniref:ergothioneine biosynthesis protein EgtB n=1 Tax=Beijerinckia sp. L45 TaxID=1641855 RepID=UPI00131B710A|nr:ergothioneine biosynthesis protein EgtB [Beijerinckia sp. L45]